MRLFALLLLAIPVLAASKDKLEPPKRAERNGWIVDPNGIPEFIRARRALQYAGSIDEFPQIMKEGNNGGYANNWLVADRKSGEIASLELGFKHGCAT